ncbi:MAG: hypothetical protein JSS82_15515 [Bacteroidetes bacterium]|nr:hypothetical protein [Bacteroidota bacterium]
MWFLFTAHSASAASYLIFEQGSDRANEVRISDHSPVPGFDCPDNSIIRTFAPVADENGNLDPDYRNYILATNGTRRVPPVSAVDSKASPDIEGFFAALAASNLFSDEEIVQALRCKMILDKDQRDAAIVRYAAGLPPEKLAALLGIAADNHLELPLN